VAQPASLAALAEIPMVSGNNIKGADVRAIIIPIIINE
jgi:hypothetical protein